MIEVSDDLFQQSLNRMAATDDGKIVLSYLKDWLHWDDVYVSHDNQNVTNYHAARRGVYASLRKVIEIKHLKDIEFNYRRKAELNDGSSGRHNTTKRTKRTKPE